MTPEEAQQQEDCGNAWRLWKFSSNKAGRLGPGERNVPRCANSMPKAAEIEAQAQSSGTDVGEVSRAVMEVQARAADQIDALEQLRKLQGPKSPTGTMQRVKSDADSSMELAYRRRRQGARGRDPRTTTTPAIQNPENNLADLGRQLEEAMACIRNQRCGTQGAGKKSRGLPSP